VDAPGQAPIRRLQAQFPHDIRPNPAHVIPNADALAPIQRAAAPLPIVEAELDELAPNPNAHAHVIEPDQAPAAVRMPRPQPNDLRVVSTD